MTLESFTKCLPISTKQGEAIKAFFEYPCPTFEVTFTPNLKTVNALKGEGYSNIAYMVLGFNRMANQWQIYVGETGKTFSNRYAATHRNAPWLKQLDENTLLFTVISVPSEKSMDFRKALEHYLTKFALSGNITPLNSAGNLDTIQQGVPNIIKVKHIAKLVIDFIRTIKGIPHPLNDIQRPLNDIQRPPISNIKQKKKTKRYPVGTKLIYRHARFGVESEVKATVTEDNKVILTSLKNAPLYSLYSNTGKKQFSSMKNNYDFFLLTAQKHVATQTYTWVGQTLPMSLTSPLAFLNGRGSENTWEEDL